MRTAIGAAIIEHGKILLVKKRQSWILPGGKLEPGESELECLCRECREELSGTELKKIRYYGKFEGFTPYKKNMLKVKVYFADIKGKLNKPSAEIAACEWASNLKKYNLPDITSKVIDSLARDGYLKR